MKKILSVFLAVLMIFAMMPTVFAASTPVITTTVDKTNINAGDIVTVTVKVSADSNLCALTYELYYNPSEFELVEGKQSLKGEFDLENAKNNVLTTEQNVFKYAGIAAERLTGSEAVLFTVQLKAKGSTGRLTASVSEAYTASITGEATNVLASVAAASFKTINFSSVSYISLQEPSTTTIRYKDGIILHVTLDKPLPAGAKIKWSTNNNNFKVTVSDDGQSATIISNKKGTTTVSATLYSITGSVLDADSVEMTSKAGFFDKLIAFFRNLFSDPEILDK